MKPKTMILALVVGVALMWGIAGWAFATPLPKEPGDDYLLNEEVNTFVGFYIREYSLARNGIVDYRTARQIVGFELDERRNTTLQTKNFPLFYWYDEDQDGRFEMWVDRKVEGCPCDITPYQAVGQD